MTDDESKKLYRLLRGGLEQLEEAVDMWPTEGLLPGSPLHLVRKFTVGLYAVVERWPPLAQLGTNPEESGKPEY